MPVDEIKNGDTVKISCAFTNMAGVPTDPTTIALKVGRPSGRTDTYTYARDEIVRAAKGSYYKNVPVGEGQTWTWRWIGTGAVAQVDQGQFGVTASII